VLATYKIFNEKLEKLNADIRTSVTVAKRLQLVIFQALPVHFKLKHAKISVLEFI
jgi:hypothetical protein